MYLCAHFVRVETIKILLDILALKPSSRDGAKKKTPRAPLFFFFYIAQVYLIFLFFLKRIIRARVFV